MKYGLLIFFFLFFHLIGHSQSSHIPLSLGVGGGVDFIASNDAAASPLTYRGFGLPLGLNAFKQSEKWINRFEIQLILPILTNNYQLKSRAKTKLNSWAKVNLKYQALRQIGKQPNNFLGGQIKSSFFYRTYDFLDGISWDFQNTLDIVYSRKVMLNDQSFLLPQVSLPLIGYINRKPSLTFDEAFLDDFNNNGVGSLLSYGKWRLPFAQWHAFEVSLLYHLALSEKINLQGTIGVNYYTINFPEKVKHLNLPIRCFLNYQL